MHPTSHAADDEYVLPTAEALLAGTLALMTGHAQSQDPEQRGRMANKIHSNLGALAQHVHLSDPFRRVVQRMGQAWSELTSAPSSHPSPLAGARCPNGWMQ